MKNFSLLLCVAIALTSLAACKKKSTDAPVVTPVVIVPEPAGTPPRTWKEHWFDHIQTVSRVYYDADLAVYYDGDVDRTILWPFKFIGDVWRYTKKTYGGHGPDPILYAIFHTNKYSGGHPDYYFSASHDYRNVIDCGPGPWLTQSGNIDLPTHEIFHIVESATFDTKGSVGFGNYPNGIWGDSKFAEIFQYDVYLGLNMPDEAKRWHDNVLNQTTTFPAPGSLWYKNWLFPWYNEHGKTQVLVDFFKLISENFPKNATNNYTRKLNWGEFIHFSSGAAKFDMKAQATIAFGWNDQWEREYAKAKTDFPKVKY
ncbi:hypothetical protein [Pedobacter metabolipauper]|uniref:Basic secretory peptidase family protein n=1 Tax=Pedobacter metabolipauper TaxID=425513 RepID=A0A4R6SX89_9SPHI|nr:hypothetical protein [Pedobacter metabolipauper]TDQ10046.1 hypothetical protein ATK78_2205 [Pedobacter metabolipauper]